MYKKILVPLDGSELGECVLNHVREIATGSQGTEVILLRIMEELPKLAYSETSEEVVQEAEAKAVSDFKDYLAQLANKLEKEGIATQTVVVHGNPAEEIINYAEKNQVDLIIMSTHGRSGISRWVFGSVADKVVHHSTFPIFIVPPKGCRAG